jgi:Na+-driven multidrug efflux pump
MDAFWFCVKLSAGVLAVLGIAGFMLAPQIISIFRKEDIDVITIGARALRFQSLSFPLSAWIIMTNMLLQTIGKSREASIVAISRQGLFFLPAILILPRLFGLTGVQISQTVSDAFSFLLAIPLGISILKELKALHQGQAKQMGAVEIVGGEAL